MPLLCMCKFYGKNKVMKVDEKNIVYRKTREFEKILKNFEDYILH